MLYIIATPIGNKLDISNRALDVLSQIDYILCESWVTGQYWKKNYASQAKLILLNEHSTKKDLKLAIKLSLSPAKIALMSDQGTPLFADPGQELVKAVLTKVKDSSINTNLITSLPGASSLMVALSLCPFNIKRFFYAGFLARKSDARQQEIKRYSSLNCPIIIYDTPYRLSTLVQDINKALPSQTMCLLCLELTTDQEEIYLISVHELYKNFGCSRAKKRFVLIIDAK
ncbi:MAG: hypothetical protein JJV97_02610 [SAR324 cluster bacterium]|nr:hypothetical protein [SAR324 cluster bacterium]